MKILITDDQQVVVDITENVLKPELDGNQITWEKGTIFYPVEKVAIVDDTLTVTLGDLFDPTNDKKEEFRKINTKAEIERLKEENRQMQDTINFLLGI
ncbi:hypothetical protein [Risungbinella massiliensis]|uniref:hypothetical protein n=1 Tax=Risungbinella massiliensis TaxID=1329796 RepID=UPI0005CC853C|nr:hypothetical protein [Risungbinella massiliensis]